MKELSRRRFLSSDATALVLSASFIPAGPGLGRLPGKIIRLQPEDLVSGHGSHLKGKDLIRGVLTGQLL